MSATEQLAKVRAALLDVPPCGKHSDDDVVTCGWKSAVQSIREVLDGDA